MRHAPGRGLRPDARISDSSRLPLQRLPVVLALPGPGRPDTGRPRRHGDLPGLAESDPLRCRHRSTGLRSLDRKRPVSLVCHLLPFTGGQQPSGPRRRRPDSPDSRGQRVPARADPCEHLRPRCGRRRRVPGRGRSHSTAPPAARTAQAAPPQAARRSPAFAVPRPSNRSGDRPTRRPIALDAPGARPAACRLDTRRPSIQSTCDLRLATTDLRCTTYDQLPESRCSNCSASSAWPKASPCS